MVTRLFSPTICIVPQSGDVLGKNLKKSFPGKITFAAEEGSKVEFALDFIGLNPLSSPRNHP